MSVCPIYIGQSQRVERRYKRSKSCLIGCVTFAIRLVTVECVSIECGISKCKQREEGEWQFSGQFALKGEREAPSRDLIFITDVGMGEYIRIFFFPHFSWRQNSRN